ncbi:MAG: DsbA family oxidoreductase [Spirulina sp. SIO3F2]|nr:DsbA family oxidoreductase [Spirulina sp. SIO3F2]
MTPPTIRIDIVSDIVCPWCIIGYKRLEKAMQEFTDHVSFDLHWHPFELNPKMPEGGQNLREHLAQKYGTTLEGSIAARKRLTEMGAALGFTFNYYDEMRMYNTFKAHQLLHWAGGQGKQTELKLQLFTTYFSEQQAVDQVEVLLNAVQAVGLDVNAARTVLEKGSQVQAVRTAQSQWLQQGIHAVPAFIFNEQDLLSGAQSTEVFKAQIAALALQAA